jgi:hypothetical protein
MNRHRAERLARIAQSKGITARAHGSAPSRPSASTPWLHVVILKSTDQEVEAWCYNTKECIADIREILDYQRQVSG